MLCMTLLGMIGTALSVVAHEFWIFPSTFFAKIGEVVELSINVGEDYVGERWGGGSRRVARLRVITPSNDTDVTNSVTQSDADVQLKPFTVEQDGTHILALETNNSFIELEPQKFDDYLKEDGLDNALAYRKKNGETQKNGRELYRRCAKTLIQVGEVNNPKIIQNTGMVLEIIPLQNPYFLPKGNPLTCQFLYEGKPLKNTLVRCWRRANGKTALEFKRSNAEGKATFSLPKKGNATYMVSMVNMVRLQNDPQADWQSTWGSLTFGLK